MQYLQYGSPTLELFTASYNNRINKTNTMTLGVETSGYTDNTDSEWLKVEENHGIYNKSISSKWWIASPYRSLSDYELRIYGSRELYVDGNEGGFLSVCDIFGESNAVRPIVCIPTSIFNSKYGTEANLVDE